MNTYMAVGNLTDNPEMVFTPSGKGIAEFAIGLNRRFTTATGEKGEEVTFVPCKAFGRTAEIAMQYLEKGDLVGVQGRLRQETWENSEGQKRSKLVVVCEQLQLMPNQHRKHPSGGGASEQAGEAAAPASGGRQRRQTAKAA